MSAIGLKLQGQFKFDLYDISGNLLKSSDFINNFITNSGICYPYHFAFADCFRFLSVGSGNRDNSINSIDETTGLHIPIPEFSYLGNRKEWNSTSTNYALSPSCGYNVSDNQISLFRQWTLPNNSGGDQGIFKEAGTFNEFMVTPGRPYVTGTDGIKLCTCNEIDPNVATGLDCSSIAEYYNWIASRTFSNPKLKICDATKAFARIVQPINFSSGTILNITYKLNITINSGKSLTSLYYNYTQSGPDKNWSGYWNFISNITQPGIKLINDGTFYPPLAPNGKERLQHFDYDPFKNRKYAFENEYGESFIPPHGAPLEPSNVYLGANISGQNIVYYFSEDNVQFLVSTTGGPLYPYQEYAPWNYIDLEKIYKSGDLAYSGNQTYKYINILPSTGHYLNETSYWTGLGYLKIFNIPNSGLKKFKNDTQIALDRNTSYWTFNPNEYNIRRNFGTSPNTGDITVSINTNKSFYNSPIVSFPNFSFNNSSRFGEVTYTFSFPGYNSSSFKVKSLVAAYKDIDVGDPFGVGDTGNLVPFFDCVFSGKELFIPQIVTGVFDGATGAQISGAGSTGYFYLSNETASPYPILNTSLKWTVPCPNGVSGCP